MLCTQLFRDETGFIVSAELVLISTIAVLAMVVGLSEVANAVNHELNDVAAAFGSINQTFHFAGAEGHHGEWSGSCFHDSADFCDDGEIEATSAEEEGD